MGKPIIWSGSNAKLINAGDLVDKNDLSLTNGDKITVAQASHGFTSSDVGRPLYLNGTTWALAQADTSAKSEIAGFIYAVLDSNTLRIATSGQCPTVGANFLEGGGSLVAGEAYFLSTTTPGKVTATEPTTIGLISKPIGVATSTTGFLFFNFRGSTVGGGNARTQLTLLNNTTANVQNVTAYDAGNLTGWVYIDATTDYRFYVSLNWAKNGVGSNWNIGYTTTGDTPPAGFNFTITSGGVIQYTMPNLAGFVTASINYSLNAPAVGATFPLSISGTNVVGGTPQVDTINQNTSANGVQIQGRTSGTIISAGYVGEFAAGSVRSGTNGDTYSVRSTTALTTSLADVISVTLNKGIYLINVTCRCFLGTGGPGIIEGTLRVGGTSVTNSVTTYVTSTTSGSVSISVPVIIKSDSTVVAFNANISTGTSSSNAQEMFVIRIA